MLLQIKGNSALVLLILHDQRAVNSPFNPICRSNQPFLPNEIFFPGAKQDSDMKVIHYKIMWLNFFYIVASIGIYLKVHISVKMF